MTNIHQALNRRPMTLRLLPVGMSFYLMRTGERYKLVSAGPSALGGYKYTVLRASSGKESTLHHSCRIKPIVRAAAEIGRSM